jgi:hypothetical protein
MDPLLPTGRQSAKAPFSHPPPVGDRGFTQLRYAPAPTCVLKPGRRPSCLQGFSGEEECFPGLKRPFLGARTPPQSGCHNAVSRFRDRRELARQRRSTTQGYRRFLPLPSETSTGRVNRTRVRFTTASIQWRECWFPLCQTPSEPLLMLGFATGAVLIKSNMCPLF